MIRKQQNKIFIEIVKEFSYAAKTGRSVRAKIGKSGSI